MYAYVSVFVCVCMLGNVLGVEQVERVLNANNFPQLLSTKANFHNLASTVIER